MQELHLQRAKSWKPHTKSSLSTSQATPLLSKTELETASAESLPTSLFWLQWQAQTFEDPPAFFPALLKFEDDKEDILYITANDEEATKALVWHSNLYHKVKPEFSCDASVALRWYSAGNEPDVFLPDLTTQETLASRGMRERNMG